MLAPACRLMEEGPQGLYPVPESIGVWRVGWGHAESILSLMESFSFPLIRVNKA